MIYERLQLEQMELDGQTTGAAYCDRRARFEERRRRDHRLRRALRWIPSACRNRAAAARSAARRANRSFDTGHFAR